MKQHDTTIELRGKVTSPLVTIEGIRARIVLPASPFGRARMRLFPSSHQELNQLMQSFKASFEAERPLSMDGTGKEQVVCAELNMLTSATKLVSPDIQRSQIKCEPVGIWHSRARDSSNVTAKSHVVFRLTPNQHLAVASHHSQHFDGSCKVTKVRQVAVELMPGMPVTFDRHFLWATEKQTDTTTRFGFTVAIADMPGDLHEPATIRNGVLPKLDDLLVLASFAASHRCVCVGWQVSDDSGRISRYDRGGIGRPSRRVPPALDTGLVPLAHFQQFVSLAWPAFQASWYLEAIRSAVYSVVPLGRTTLEHQYLSMFAALEELVLVYRRQNEKQFILPREEWKPVERAIKEAIKSRLSEAGAEARSMLYDNLGGVNRVPLRRVFEQFVAHLNVDLTDLWPVFCGKGDGLGAIRNKLAHGDLDSTASMGVLAIATEHLEWTLDRIILALLRWPIEKSEVRPTLLAQHAIGMQRFGEARGEMARVLNR